MKKVLLFVFVLCFGTSVYSLLAQERYLDQVFTQVTKTADINYGWNYSVLTGTPAAQTLYLDFYEPTGDTEVGRPLVIMIHGGSFLPKGANQMPWGNKSDSNIVEMSNRFAKRGFVAAAIDYRLGWNPVAADQETKANTIINAVYKSMQDVKTAIRFFKADAAGANLYNIDTTRIILAGDGSGGYCAIACGALDKVSETQYWKFLDGQGNSFINMSLWGDIDGNAATYCNYDHPGHTSDANIILNMEGAIGDTLWQEAGEIPMVSVHGVANVFTPDTTGIVIVLSTGDPVVEVSGSHDLEERAQRIGNSQSMINAHFTDPYSLRAESLSNIEGYYPIVGAANGNGCYTWWDPADAFSANGFQSNPYASATRARAYIDTIMGYFIPRAVVVLNLPGASQFGGIHEIVDNSNVNIYPNPAQDQINVYSNNSNNISAIQLYTITGVLVESFENMNTSSYSIKRNDLSSGMYLLRIKSGDNYTTKKVIFR